MKKVSRLYPESKTGLIKWIEDNFHDIEQFVFTAQLKDDTTMFVYDCYSYYDAVAMTSISLDTVHCLSHDDAFVAKERK